MTALSKQPRFVLDGVDFGGLDDACARNLFAFPPNRSTLGGTSYLIVEKDVEEKNSNGESTGHRSSNILIDCPAWDEATHAFLQTQGGVRSLVLTHRGGMGKVRDIQAALGCEVVVQEQEAYLLPGLTVTTFQHELQLSDRTQVFWTAGHSPGSSCVYFGDCGGVLFTGRHLLPDRQGNPIPLRTAKTFHWKRQIRQVQGLLDRFSPETLRFICPGASIGFLRGKLAIDGAYDQLARLDLVAQLQLQPLL